MKDLNDLRFSTVLNHFGGILGAAIAKAFVGALEQELPKAFRGMVKAARGSLPPLASSMGRKTWQPPAVSRPRSTEPAVSCAIKGCGKPTRTKGYCAAHYQKLRMLEKSNRRPPAWGDYAKPNSVDDLKLPRGRAASKAFLEKNSRPL